MHPKAITVFPSGKAISRSVLLEFLRHYINPQLEAIEDLRTGADFCLGMKILFPETICLNAVKFGPGLSDISTHKNFKILQSSFAKVGVERDVPMENLMKGNFQANFYFGQWYMGFFTANYAGQEYNPNELRNSKKTQRGRINKGGSGYGGGHNTSKIPVPINRAKYNFRDKHSCAKTTVDISVQTDESYIRDEAKYMKQARYVEELELKTAEQQKFIQYLQEESKKLASAIECTNINY